MILKDTYMRVILTVIAILLALILIRPYVASVVPNAEAAQQPVFDVTLLKKVPAEGLRGVIVLGDAKTFILQQKDQVLVYRVDYQVK